MDDFEQLAIRADGSDFVDFVDDDGEPYLIRRYREATKSYAGIPCIVDHKHITWGPRLTINVWVWYGMISSML